jgi:hypothetical protein
MWSSAPSPGCSPSGLHPPSQIWRPFLANHVRDLVSIDFFTAPTARLRVLFVLVVLAHHRRRVLHFNVTEHPTATWTAQAGGSLAKRWCASGPCRDAQPHGLLAARSAAVDAAVRSAARDRCSAVRPAAPGGRGGRATTRSPLTASAYATLKARSTVRTCALKTTVSGRGSYSLSTIGTVEAYIARDCFQRGGSP